MKILVNKLRCVAIKDRQQLAHYCPPLSLFPRPFKDYCDQGPVEERPATCSDPDIPRVIQERAWRLATFADD